ncbi:hypothetical protein [Acetobacter fallax]|uniref:Uncharacterized protein n=1 Tax=Acetobacter fallax TaxID=1737473 RepID=A0ABX0KGZ4_9PROT|nr:hypothetical protein [Acetobacter fallax]NHO34353.1 hypothetical protein [Acetobacter fallax]NHO37922.1 hypothetical protein [Acetobacter fallax]
MNDDNFRPGPERLYIRDPIFSRDGILHIHLADVDMPLRVGGKFCSNFVPGWKAVGLYTGFAPLYLLALQNDTGDHATWYLDWRLERLTDNVAELSQDFQDLLRVKALPLVMRLFDQVTARCTPVMDPELQIFFELCDTTRLSIARLCLPALAQTPIVQRVNDLGVDFPLFTATGPVRLSRQCLEAGFATDWQDRLATSFDQRRLTWESPVDGTELSCQGTIIFDDFHFAFRFADPRYGLTFFVLVAGHCSVVMGLWFPAQNTMLVPGHPLHSLQFFIHDAGSRTLIYAARWGALLIPYLVQGACRFANIMRGRGSVHLGHQLWNELSGIESLIEGGCHNLPECVVLDAVDQTELYGPIDRLFPEMEGRVERRFMGELDPFIAHICKNGYFAFRATREYISDRLRSRILQLATSAVPSDEFNIANGRMAVLIGLRVENRTLVDVEAFFSKLLAVLADAFPGLVVLFDGHNSRSETDQEVATESFSEHLAKERPVRIEQAIVSALSERFRDAPIEIVSLVGRPIATSVLWASRVNAFVSIWGASLAKYRWVANKTGFIITSRSNLEHRADLHIYDSPHYMESPSPVTFVRQELVRDDPDAEQLVPAGPGHTSFFNFRLDEPACIADIVSFIVGTRA